MTLGERKKQLAEKLNMFYETGEANAIAIMVAEKISGKNRGQQFSIDKSPLTGKEENRFIAYEKELLKGRPVQYVLEEAWFMNKKFYVHEHVLIPRPETEELVLLTIKKARQREDAANRLKILDIGTGSGCIAISLALALPNASVSAVDVSMAALKIAEKNASILQANVNLIKQDILNENDQTKLEQYDVIISNPPYIPASEQNKLAKNVTEWEPHIALFTPDDDPLVFYKAIAKLCLRHLKPGGFVAVEGHQDYMQDVLQIFSGNPFKEASVVKDIHENERMVFATRP